LNAMMIRSRMGRQRSLIYSSFIPHRLLHSEQETPLSMIDPWLLS
jgi:hypothetical protein